MKILFAGDSFTYGQNLINRERDAYPWVLGRKLNAEVKNIAYGGHSNQSIIRTLVEELTFTDVNYDLVFVGLTNPGRVEWKDKEVGYYNVWPGRTSPYVGHIDELIKYITVYHDDEYLLDQWFIQAQTIEKFLIANNLNFLIYGLDFHHDYYFTNYPMIVERWSKTFTPYSMLFNQENSIVRWQESNKLPCDHPNERGHELIAERLYEHIRHFGWIS